MSSGETSEGRGRDFSQEAGGRSGARPSPRLAGCALSATNTATSPAAGGLGLSALRSRADLHPGHLIHTGVCVEESDLALAAHGNTAAGLGAATRATPPFAAAGAGAGWHTAADGHTAAGAAASGTARAAHGSGG